MQALPGLAAASASPSVKTDLFFPHTYPSEAMSATKEYATRVELCFEVTDEAVFDVAASMARLADLCWVGEAPMWAPDASWVASATKQLKAALASLEEIETARHILARERV